MPFSPLLSFTAPLLLALSALLPVSGDEFVRARDGLRAALKGSDGKVQIEAIRALAAIPDRRVPAALLEILTELRRTLDSARDRIGKVARAIDEAREQRHRARDPDTTPWRTADARLKKAETERDELTALLARGSDVTRAARTGLADSVNAMPEEFRRDEALRLVAELKGGRDLERRREALLVLGSIAIPEARVALRTTLGGDPEPRLRADAAEAMAELRHPENFEILVAALKDPFWMVRAAVVTTLRAFATAEAVDALLDALPNETGRLQGDVVEALGHLTGQNFHDNAALWRDWWEKNRRGFRPPGRRTGDDIVEPGGGSAPPPAGAGGRLSFYGIETDSDHICFIIDASGSMNERVTTVVRTGVASEPDETKLDRARRELLSALDRIPVDGLFNIIAFSDEVRPFDKSIVRMTDAARREARAFVQALTARGNTNIIDALERAFGAAAPGATPSRTPLADTFYFLSDGQATAGRILEGRVIADEIARRNRDLRARIHAIGIGAGHDVELMRRLASDSGGRYVSIGR